MMKDFSALKEIDVRFSNLKGLLKPGANHRLNQLNKMPALCGEIGHLNLSNE